MIECQRLDNLLVRPETPLSAPISADLVELNQGLVCDPSQSVKGYEFGNFDGVKFLNIDFCPGVHAGDIDIGEVTEDLLGEKGLTFSSSEDKSIEVQIFGNPDKKQTDLMIPLDNNNEIIVTLPDGQVVILNAFSLIDKLEKHGQDSENIDIRGYLSFAAIAALAISSVAKKAREKSKQERYLGAANSKATTTCSKSVDIKTMPINRRTINIVFAGDMTKETPIIEKPQKRRYKFVKGPVTDNAFRAAYKHQVYAEGNGSFLHREKGDPLMTIEQESLRREAADSLANRRRLRAERLDVPDSHYCPRKKLTHIEKADR